MKRLQRLSTEHGARELLQRLVEAGRCRLEDFDQPPPGHLNPAAYRNLLRVPDDLTEPKVEITNPRDFSPKESENPLPY
jgi:hypothetical protein